VRFENLGAHVEACNRIDRIDACADTRALVRRRSAELSALARRVHAPRPVSTGMSSTGRLRIVIASAHPGESEVLADWLASDGFEPVPASSLGAARCQLEAQSCDLLISDVKLAFLDGLHEIGRGRMRNPHTPIVVIGDDDSNARRQAERRQAMFLQRPVDRTELLCYVAMAAGEARPSRRSPRKPVGRIESFVDGAPSSLIDVSNEGLRIEVARDQRVSPPYFSVKVPIVGVSLMVHRVWTNGTVGSAGKSLTLYGGALAQNEAKILLAWRRFVDSLPNMRP
jgi:CheY-like chemotaxis protein